MSTATIDEMMSNTAIQHYSSCNVSTWYPNPVVDAVIKSKMTNINDETKLQQQQQQQCLFKYGNKYDAIYNKMIIKWVYLS